MGMFSASHARSIADTARKHEKYAIERVWNEIERKAKHGNYSAFVSVENEFSDKIVSALRSFGFRVSCDSRNIYDYLTIDWEPVR